MIVTVSGVPGSGKSTLAKNLAEKLGLKHHSAGEFMRQIARERGLSILQLGKIAEKDKSIDREIDKRTVRLAREEDNFVMDSRLAWHFIPKSVKIFVDIDLKEAAKRIFQDMRPDEKENSSLEKTLKNLQKRLESERKRYKKLYAVDYLDKSNYDLLLNTSNMTQQETVGKAIGFLKKGGKA